MTDEPRPPEEDSAADTQMFRAFVEREESAPVKPGNQTFRIVTLLAGLVILAAVIYLLLQP